VVSDESLPHIRHLYGYKNTRTFREELDWLLKHFRPLHPSEFSTAVINRQPLPPKTFLLSFDDGFREVHDVIAPVLREKGVPALFFINPAFIGNQDLFYRCKLSLVLDALSLHPGLAGKIADHFELTDRRTESIRQMIRSIGYADRHRANELGSVCELDFNDFLASRQPFLTLEQMKDLRGQGFVFGAHSIDHPKYEALNLEEQYNQTVNSLQYTRDMDLADHSFFAFPHSDLAAGCQLLELVRSRYDKNTIFFGVRNQREERSNLVFHRFNAERPEKRLSLTVKQVLLYNATLRILGRSEIKRQW
jgi:peptidoglycan/xylan/chitin deacetylase (PgdA/CDA1 family)